METPLTIGIVGGMSPESTTAYYRHIVRAHVAAHGDHSYPRMVIASVSFQAYIEEQHAGAWDVLARRVDGELASLAAAGADFAIIAANTMHKVVPALGSRLPLLHVLDAVAEEARRLGVRRLGLTGTAYTMNDGFYAAGLEERGLGVVLPDAGEREAIHRMIYDDLIVGRVRPEARNAFAEVSRNLAARGAEAVLLACTELVLVAPPPEVARSIDTAEVHALAAWRRALRPSRPVG